MRTRITPEQFPRHRFPVDEWRFYETEYHGADLGLTETIFGVNNGYLGLRANPSEGRDAHNHGTYLNGFHETWDIHHAENAHALAKTGQTLVNVPDAKLIKLYVDDEPLLLADADLEHYERGLDFANGHSYVNLRWRTPADKLVEVRSTRMVSLVHRHLAVLTYEVELINEAAPVVISSQLLNRQDGEDEYHVEDAALGEGADPRQTRRFDSRVLRPTLRFPLHPRRSGHMLVNDDPIGAALDESGASPAAPGDALDVDVILGYRTGNSRMTMAAAYRHELETNCEYAVTTFTQDDLAKTEFRCDAEPGKPIKITKFVSYHSSRGVPTEELADRCRRTLHRAAETGVSRLREEQRTYLDDFWARSDIQIDGNRSQQQLVRWHLFQLAQASARTHENGIAAKGVTGGGYDGHYFWDTEVYVLPFLAYTNPAAARKLLRFRWKMLDAARARARELSHHGALYPWRTINGEEASAYYAAGTAQYHINAAVTQALQHYSRATSDTDFHYNEAAEILVETARLWEDLGFYAVNGKRQFHIHGVTGPDEYTTVVNDNLYTNVMARFNLSFAASTVREMEAKMPAAFEKLHRATGVNLDEVATWEAAAEAMHVPYDQDQKIHPQDQNFLERERWPFADTPDHHYPLLLNYHPLTIYRHQVLKQADVVLAMFLQPEHFTADQMKRNFDYYDELTTGDSSLAACVQSIMAARVDRRSLAHQYYYEALYLDLVDAHGNTADGVHLANSGGIWAALVHGFAGMDDHGDYLSFAPHLPPDCEGLRIRFVCRGSVVEANIGSNDYALRVIDGPALSVKDQDGATHIVDNSGMTFPLPSETGA